MNKLKISVVIPNWNGAWLLQKNLPYVLSAKENRSNQIVEVIVVDDGSTDDSVGVLSREFSGKVRTIIHKRNRGFSAAVNTGVRFSKGTHVCLLNTDVVPNWDFLEKTLTHLDDELVFGVTFNEGGHGPAVGEFDGFLKHKGGEMTDLPQETLWISGGSGVVSKRVWKQLHGLDSELLRPFYWEDVDLGYRAHKRGYRLIWEPKAQVAHNHETIINTNNFKKRYLNIIKERNELLFIWKNITSKPLIKKHQKSLFNRLKQHPGYIKVVLAALLKWSLVVQRRKREREEATVSDEAVLAKFSGKP